MTAKFLTKDGFQKLQDELEHLRTVKRQEVADRLHISERTVKEKIGPATYTLVLRGSTVVSIDPPGQHGPLYQDRGKYRKGQAEWRKVERFIPEEEIQW